MVRCRGQVLFIMIRQPPTKKQKLVWGLISSLTLLGLYTFLAYKHEKKNEGSDNRTIPTWTMMGEGLEDMYSFNKREGSRWIVMDSKATLSRLGVGLGVGVFLGVSLGMLMGCFGICEALFLPILSFAKYLVPTAMLSIFFSVFSFKIEMYVALIACGIVPPLSISILLAIKEVPEELIFKSYTLGSHDSEVVFNPIFWSVLPNIIDFIRLAVGPAMVYLIAGEMIAASEGFGYRIRLESSKMRMDISYPYLLHLAAFGFFVNYGLVKLRSKVCSWY